MTKTIKQQLSRISPLSAGLVLAFAAVMTYFLIQTLAATGTASIYTSPGGSQSVTKGSNFSVNIRISTSGNAPVTAASLHMSYPTDKVAVQGVDFSGSPYNLEVAQTNSGSVLRLDRAALPMISGGDKLFAKVTFKATGDGQANIGFTDSSYVISGDNDSNLPLQKNGVTYNISAPSTNSSPGTSRGASGNNKPATSEQSRGNSTANGGTNNTSSSSLDQDQTGDRTKEESLRVPTNSSDSSTKTNDPGFNVQILVFDRDKNPINNAEVIIGGKNAKTDENGFARFKQITAGDHEIVVNYKGKKTLSKAQVKGSVTTKPESFTVEIESNKMSPLVWILPPLIGILLAVGVLFGRPWAKEHISFFNNQGIVLPKKPADEIQLPISPNAPLPGSTYSPDSQNSAQTPKTTPEQTPTSTQDSDV